jgi:hypothetical protein
MNAQKRMMEAVKNSEAIAKKLTSIGMKVRIMDAFTKGKETVTTSMPWKLGHGQWVVSVEGKFGGWNCDMLEVLESEVAK